MKQLTGDSYIIRPFVTNKTQTINYTFLSGSAQSASVSIDIATQPPAAWTWDVNNEPINPSGISQHTLYSSVQQLLYNEWVVANTGSNNALGFSPTGSQFYVISVAQPLYGEAIRANSITLTSPASTSSLVDDGAGRIVSTDGRVVGNVFYSLGIVVLAQSMSPFTSSIVSDVGVYFDSGSQIGIEFDATHTIYEYQVICTMDPGEFNYSMNPSVRRDGTRTVLDQFVSGSLSPYMTSVGLYNDAGEMVATAKFPRALKRAVETQQSILVRFDL